MNPLQLPWLEISVVLPFSGVLCISRLKNPAHSSRWGLGFTAAVFACTLLAWLSFYVGIPPERTHPDELQIRLFGKQYLMLDELSAPLVPAVALLHFLTALATARTKVRRFSFSWSLASEGIRLAVFSCREPWVLIALLAMGKVLPCIELLNRGKSTRVYVLHMGLFVGLLVLGWSFVETDGNRTTQTALATLPLLAAILVHCGTVPVHCWVTNWFESASFGNALLFVVPLASVYAVVRLVLPIAPLWALQSISFFSLTTTVYAAAMATVQKKTRRFFAFFFLSHASLVLVGLELVTSLSLTGALCLWFSVILSLGGFGLTLRALEARFGQQSLSDFHGLYKSSPALAVCFLVTGLACVGFPGTLGFVSTELLVDGAIGANLYVGLVVVTAGALNGIAVLRAYFMLFTGKHYASTVSLGLGLRERIAVLTLTALILVGGLLPQPGVRTRYLAAEAILKNREARMVREGVVVQLKEQEP